MISTINKILILKFIILLLGSNVYAQSKILRGQVIDENFEPLSNAIIRIDSSSKTFETDDFGSFEINIDSDTKSIEVIIIGHKTERVFLENKCYVNVVLININGIEFETKEEKEKFYSRSKNKLKKKYKKALKSGLLKSEENCN